MILWVRLAIGFKAEEEIKNYLLVGGGIGVAPLCLIAKELVETGKNVFFLAGFKDETFFLWERDLIKIVRNYKIFTENGSFGAERHTFNLFKRKPASL